MDKINLTLYIGRVIDNNDPDEKGFLKIKILPEMIDVLDIDCPWIKPYIGLNNDSSKLKKIKEGILVWCLIDPLWRELYYLDNYSVKNIFNYDIVKAELNNISELNTDSKNYQYMDFELFNDGSLMFHNINTGERGFLYKSGSYFIHKTNGDFVSDNTGFKVIVQGNKLSVDGETKSLVTHAELDTALQGLVSSINAEFLKKLDGSGTPGLLTIDISLSETTKIKTS